MSGFRALLGRFSTVSDRITSLIKTVQSRVTKYTITLIALFVAVFLVRFLTINAQVGPPSEDLGRRSSSSSYVYPGRSCISKFQARGTATLLPSRYSAHEHTLPGTSCSEDRRCLRA